ncbi:hypothetical protein Bca52824_037928 [Brassica carinata]|uniref:AB hydrolase-1 domain-containing protein n=1 Tax=Brassica carinata TaxID=52824 RepID=A0A8X7RLI1_BRACI|nr:hypothetical protein Bca52824_037928 [Brassica carinata]
MVNLAVALRSSMCIIVKSAGLVPHTVETEPGTKVNFWLPKNSGGKPEKPAVLLIHGFAGDGVMTWAFQARSLSKRYSVYIPDLLFFGGSYTDKPDRILGVDKFVLVGFSCGGVVASKIAELYGNMAILLTNITFLYIHSTVVTGAPPIMTDSNVNRFGLSSMSDVLLPKTVKGLEFLLSVSLHKRIWLPSCPLKDYLKTMFTNRKEMAELLEALIINNDTTTLPSFPQRIDLLWGENDLFFSVEFAKDLQRKLGEMTSMESIKMEVTWCNWTDHLSTTNFSTNFLLLFIKTKFVLN